MARPLGHRLCEPYQNFDGDDQSSESTKPLAKDWRGVGEWSEAPSYEEGVGGDGEQQGLPCIYKNIIFNIIIW